MEDLYDEELKNIVKGVLGPITNKAWKKNKLELLEDTVHALWKSQRRRERVWSTPAYLLKDWPVSEATRACY